LRQRPNKLEGFIAATGLLGPRRSIHDLRRAAQAIYGPAQERLEEFNAVFDAALPLAGRFSRLPRPKARKHGAPFDAGEIESPPQPEDETASGQDATALERLSTRPLLGADEEAVLRACARLAGRCAAASVASASCRPVAHRPIPRRAFRELLRRDGELSRLPRRHRLQRQRRVLLLIDVSGSMKAGTDAALRLAHAMVQALERAEVFTIGTRLTRVTRALRYRNREQALYTRRRACRGLGWRHAVRRGAGRLSFRATFRKLRTWRGGDHSIRWLGTRRA
jgi:uncharacterized protein with von Willebrand factor type A (vWA) domain